MHRPSPNSSPRGHPNQQHHHHLISHPQTPATPSIPGAPSSPHLSASPSAATPGSDPASPIAHASHAHLSHHHPSLLHFLPFHGAPVVADQRAKFENDELLRKLSRESEIRYTGHRDRPHDERVMRFAADCRDGRLDIAYASTGTNFGLVSSNSDSDFFDFDREPGKVHVSSSLIFNGVCVKWVGVLDLQRIDGVGQLQFDEVAARAFQGQCVPPAEAQQQADHPVVTASA